MVIQYQGERLRLRPISSADLPQILEWQNDPLVRDPAMGYRGPVSPEQVQNWYEALLKDRRRLLFGIESLDEPPRLVGYIQLSEIDWISGTASFGIAIGASSYRGQGLGREAILLLINYAWEALNLRKICLQVLEDNPARRLYTSLGFQEEGCLRKHHYLEGRYLNLCLMALFREGEARK